MGEFNFGNIVGGVMAYCVALGVAYLAYTLNIRMTSRDDVALLKKDHRATAIVLGMTILCQCFLTRHAVFASMAIIRLLFVKNLNVSEKISFGFRTILLLILIVSLALLAVRVAGGIFKLMTRGLDEDNEIANNNISVATFYGIVLVAMTLIIDEGMQDLSQSLISFGRTGVLRIP